MENERHCKVSSKSHLPEQLCREILLRLPVKSLLRFRCVSKSWLSLINDPEFCRVHLKTFKNNRDETHLLVVDGCFAVRCSAAFETIPETLHAFGDKWQIVCYIDGLVMLKYENSNSRCFNDLMVWNPSTRKFHDIPPLPEIEASPYSRYQEVEIGLGYDPLVKDYKYVKLIFVNDVILDLHTIAIYTLGAGLWKTVQFEGKGCSDFEWDLDYTNIKAVYLRGSLYFLGIHRKREAFELVSFDLSSEVFCSVNFPDDIDYWDYLDLKGSFTIFRYGCSSVATLDTLDEEICMWVWESESMCWTRTYSLDLNVSYYELLYLHKSHDILMIRPRKETSLRPATRKRLGQRVSSYNLETGEEKILMEKGKDDFKFRGVYAYIESLVPVK